MLVLVEKKRSFVSVNHSCTDPVLTTHLPVLNRQRWVSEKLTANMLYGGFYDIVCCIARSLGVKVLHCQLAI